MFLCTVLFCLKKHSNIYVCDYSYLYSFICKNTVEEKILALQEKKLSLAHNVLTG